MTNFCVMPHLFLVWKSWMLYGTFCSGDFAFFLLHFSSHPDQLSICYWLCQSVYLLLSSHIIFTRQKQKLNFYICLQSEFTDLGPYTLDFTASGRYMAVSGRKGHLAVVDMRNLSLIKEFQVCY